MEEKLNELFSHYEGRKDELIPILQDVQNELGYLPEEAIKSISRCLNLPEVDVLGVATFYEQFKFNEPGEHIIKICEGTACHVKGGAAIIQSLERELSVRAGETSDDGLFSLERVACLGCCALAPVMVVNKEIHGQMNPSKLTELLAQYRTTEEE